MERDTFTCPLPAGAENCVGGRGGRVPPPMHTCIPPCDGSSATLTDSDCSAWQHFTRDPMYTKWAESKCGAKVHTDPCSCTFEPTNETGAKVQCADGRITHLPLWNSGIPELSEAIFQLTGLTLLRLDGNHLTGTIPANVGALTALAYLNLGSNQLTGLVPASLSQLTSLKEIGLNGNVLEGRLPPLNFSQFTDCCRTDGRRERFLLPFTAWGIYLHWRPQLRWPFSCSDLLPTPHSPALKKGAERPRN
jgi:hypothetical protein